MSSIISVDRKMLNAVYTELNSAVSKLAALVADLGCLHSNAFDVTTMDGTNKRKLLCPDCGETIEEEIQDELEF